MRSLSELKRALKELVPKGNDVAIKGIKQYLPVNTSKYNSIIELESRFRDNHSKLLKRVINDELANLESNRIREAILLFIDSLEDADFVEPKQGPDKKSKYQTGKILYRIPNIMQVDVECPCIIRIAFDEETLTYDLSIQLGDEIKELKRISEVMSVELIDPSDFTPFKIKSFSEPIQFVDEDDYTEWKYFVTPLMAGEFSLLLKVSIIEMKMGKERKRDIVLQEQVQIITETPIPNEEITFKTHSETINRMGDQVVSQNQVYPTGTGKVTLPKMKEPARKSVSAKMRNWQKGLATMLMLLVGASIGWAIPGVREEIRWINTAYVKNSKTAFESYKKQYPESQRIKIIEQRIEDFEWEEYLSATPETKEKELKDYKAKYDLESGRHYEKALEEIKKINKDSSTITQVKKGVSQKEKESTLKNKYTQLIEKATLYFNQGKYKKALGIYQQAKEILKENAEANEGIRKCKEQIYLAEKEKNQSVQEDVVVIKEQESPAEKQEVEISEKASPEANIEIKRQETKTAVIKKEALEKQEEEKEKELTKTIEKIESGSFSDVRDQEIYNWKLMEDGKKWMTRNLNFNTPDSYCVDEQEANCQKYGRLYTWDAAQQACPTGWRLPSDEEWDNLRALYGGSNKTYRFLKARKNGFLLSFGGKRTPDGAYDGLNNLGYFWSQTEKNTEEGWVCHFSKIYSNIRKYEYDKNWGFSCRCIQD